MAEINLNLNPQILNLSLYAGDGANFRLVVTNSLNEPVPLTGTMKAQIRVKRDSADPPSAEFTIDLTDAATGIALLTLAKTDTQALVTTKKFVGVWDLEWTPTDAEPITILQGKVECFPDVSR